MPVRIAVIILLVLLIMPAAWAAAIVTVASESSVTGPLLTLGDIAEISGDDAAKVSALKALRLGAAPKPGGHMILTRELLGARLSGSGTDLTGIAWNVPPTIVITANMQWVSGQKVAAIAAEAVVSRLNLPEDKREIALIGLANDIAAPPGEIKLNAELPYGIRKSGPTIVTVTVSADGRTYEKVSLRYNVRLFEDIVVVSKPLEAHEPITADKLAYQRTDLSRLTGGYYTDIAKLTGLAAKKAITPGTILTGLLLEKPVIVKRGSNVTILVQSGGIEITAAGQALQDGAEGQLIRVQNTSSKRSLTAKVVGEGLVQITTVK